jgi:hypothetical protein
VSGPRRGTSRVGAALPYRAPTVEPPSLIGQRVLRRPTGGCVLTSRLLDRSRRVPPARIAPARLSSGRGNTASRPHPLSFALSAAHGPAPRPVPVADRVGQLAGRTRRSSPLYVSGLSDTAVRLTPPNGSPAVPIARVRSASGGGSEAGIRPLGVPAWSRTLVGRVVTGPRRKSFTR